MSQASALPSTQLLIVDNDPQLIAQLSDYFGRYGYAVRTAQTGAAAREAIAQCAPGLLIMDTNLRGEDGLSLARLVRKNHPASGLMMLTMADSTIDRIVGLEVGADDYLCKPFDARELLARVRAVMRRIQSGRASGKPPATPARTTDLVRFGPCQLDLEGRRLLSADGAEVEISSSQFELLALYTRNPNRPLNRDQILDGSSGEDVFDRSVDLRVMRLRRKIEPTPDSPRFIRTIRNVGYVYVPDAHH